MAQQPERIIAAQPDEVRRELTVRRDEKRQHTFQTISRSYPTTVDDLWEACTQADRLERWFAPVNGDLQLGGRYQVEGNASGEVVACEPPQSFTVTWEFAGDSSQVVVHLTRKGTTGPGSPSNTRTRATSTRISGPGSDRARRGWAGTSRCWVCRCT
ncbi:SRPBCC domain-containing protein [Pseudonocardia sp. MH-G8]|uniref:SRPBCC domain-containing protein n=1 Tax=Pseudonocardia sp. MH-G8 TaxID=1854588 RepID=UPI000BA16374|nr:hypothetical protein CFP66_13975 [Pseudonocardia sp. MH-G8]